MTDFLVLPRTFEAFRLIVSEKILDMQLPNQAPTMMGHPLSGSARSIMQPVNGTAISPITTRQRRFGNIMQAMIPIQIATICTAPDGDP